MYGKNIKYLRKQRKMTQKELSELAEMTRDGIAKLEAEQTKPSFDTLIKLREIFNVSLDDLIFIDIENK